MDQQSNGNIHRYQQHAPPTRDHVSLKRGGHIESQSRRLQHGSQQRIPQDSEEEEYERRREEELKKQIRVKEQEIQNLAKASDYLRSKLDHQITGQQRQQQQEQDRYASFGRQVPEKLDKSPYRSTPKDPPPTHVREHIANLQSDNASLMRRLNLVLQELERVTREKEDIQSRLQQYAKETMNMQRMLSGEDNVDKVNKYMQEDLMYEKDRNDKLKQQIQEYDDYKNDLIKDLRKVEDSQSHLSHSGQNIASDLQKRISQISDIEKEIYYTQEKLKQVQVGIEQQKREEQGENVDKMEMQRIINQLSSERNELLSKLDNLTERYDDCVREISRDRQDMERHNRQHSKLVTSKVLFQQMEVLLKNRLQKGFKEIQIYCDFDHKCHKKLQQFVKVLDIIGKYKMKVSIGKWYQETLKPMECKQQSKQIALIGNNQQIKQKYFYNWIRNYQGRIKSYDLKTKAVQTIWNIKKNDVQVETKRSFQIWKETLSHFKLRKSRVQKLIFRLYFNKISQSFLSWQNHTTNIDLQVRLSLLSQKFTHKQYLNLIYQNIKMQSYERKRKRINTLFHCVKYWKDYINYRKFLMGAQVSALHFKQHLNTSILQSCFDALKQNKEVEKYQRVHQQLNSVERQQIDQLTGQIQQVSDETRAKLQKRAGEFLMTFANKSMNVYFRKWKRIYTDFKEVPDSKIKGRIIKAYYDKIRMAFNRWKVLNNSLQLQSNEVILLEQQEMQKDLQNEVIQIQKEIKDKKSQQDQSQHKQMNKVIRNMQKRFLKQGMDRWRDKMNEVNVKENGADTVVKRLRTRILRQAFDLYLSGVKYQKKIEIDEDRCSYYNKTRAERLKKQVFHNWTIYKNNFSKSKEYWYRIYLRMDRLLTERGFKRWAEAKNVMKQEELQAKEQQQIEDISEMNHEIGEITQVEEQQQVQLKQMKQQMTEQAQRVLSNTFAKFYYINQTRGIEKWKDYVLFEKRRERLLKRIVEHWKRYQFNFVKNCLQNWIIFANINEKKELIKKEEGRIKDMQFVYGNQNKNFSQSQQQLTQELEGIKGMQEKYNSRLQKCIGMIVNKVDKNDFVSSKRYIFIQWRQYVKRELAFIKCIQNVVQKSLWTQGFKSIKSHSRSDLKTEVLTTVLTRFRQKFWKKVCGNSFSVWRSGQFAQIAQTIEETVESRRLKEEKHQDKVMRRKEVNANKALRIMGKQNLRNLFAGWKNVAQHYQMHGGKGKQYRSNIELLQKKQAMFKWYARKQATKVARERVTKLKHKFQRMRLTLFFNALRTSYSNNKEFVSRMSNFARIFDHHVLKSGYDAIISYSRAKEYVHYKQKEHASSELFGALQRLLIRKEHQYLNELKYRTVHSYKQRLYKTLTIMHNCNNNMRHFFLVWKEQAEKVSIAQEMQEEGPIREQIFEEAIKLKNLQNYLKDEGYHESDINGALTTGAQNQSALMLKTVRRLQHYNEPLFAKPKFFDKWRQYVQYRKMMRYWLQYAANRSQYIKSDIAVAFDRWKKQGSVYKEQLSKQNKRQLESILLKNSENLGNLADEVQDKEQELRHLSDQRDELVENYIKGQKLALALWVNNRRRTLHKAMVRWSKNAGEIKTSIQEGAMRRNVELIAALKDKIRQLEKDNGDLSGENEELRQFSLDGYEIAKNVQALSAEREKLSVDLADKAQTIRKLLDENEKLNKKLRTAQDEAEVMIKSTSNKFSGSQKKPQPSFQSPMVRSNVY